MPEPMNANRSSGTGSSSSSAAVRISKALEYRAAQSVVCSGDEDAAISDDVTGAAELNELLERMQQADGAGRAQVGQGPDPHAVRADSSQHASTVPAQVQRGYTDATKRPIKTPPINASQRVRSAMAAALEYRQRQAAASSAAATAAAEAAQAPPAKAKGTASAVSMRACFHSLSSPGNYAYFRHHCFTRSVHLQRIRAFGSRH